MDKLRMRTPNKADENFRALAAMFPSAVTETTDENGEVVRAIDKDVLMQEISCKVVDGRDERYQFTWPDKRKAVLLANAPTDKTLRPCCEESVDFDGTQNLYIEGDNLEVLKLLQETYLGKVKMIYIDPPYNTGNDFVYGDDFAQDAQTYRQNSGQYDGEGNRLFQNTESNGRFHTDWLNMMYPRLRLARDLLSDDGVIFISIDDNEVENLKKICNEIFGEGNFEGHIHWRRRHNQPNDKTKMIGLVAEHILVYAKDSQKYKKSGVGKLDLTVSFSNPDNDPNGPWASKPWKVGTDQSGSRYKIKNPKGMILDEEWMGDETTYNKFVNEGRIYFPKGGDGMPRKKYYQFERETEGQCATNWWTHEIFGHNQDGNDEMTGLFGGRKNIFSNPKPTKLLSNILKIANTKNDSIILDFFSGGATTAHAVMQLNAEDGGNRRFIMVQLPEPCGENSEAYKAGYQNICEIGKERIRRAGAKIKEETGLSGQSLDTGFRVLRLDSSNMRDVYCSPQELVQKDIAGLVDNVKGDRTPLDLLFQQIKYEDQILYHYTSLEALKSILENRTIRLTDYRFLNDPKELHFGIDIFKNAIPKDINEYHFKIALRALNNMENDITHCFKIGQTTIQTFAPNKTNFYILSMTDKRDDLALWNAYAKNGCCIKFNHQAIFSYFSNIIQTRWKNGIFNYNRGKVHYGQYSETEMKFYLEMFQRQGASLEANIDYEIRQICSLNKDEAYKYESEYRIGINYIDAALIDGTSVKKQFVIKDGLVKPQIELADFAVEELIEEIIVSPYNNFDCAVLGVQELVHWFSKKDIPVRASGIKIR